MTRERLTMSFYIDKKRERNGEVTLQCRVSFRKKSKTFSTGLKVPIVGWDAKKQSHTKRSERSKVINQQIDSWKSKLIVAKDELLKREVYFTVEDLVQEARGRLSTTQFMTEVYDNYVKENKEPYVEQGRLSKALLIKHRRTLSALKSYISEKYQRQDVDLRQVDYGFIIGFKTFLVTSENLAHNTALKHMQRLREVFLYCSSNGWVVKDPFKSFKFRFEPVDRSFLTQTELDSIESYVPPSESLERVKDVFLFSCYTGLSYSDIKKLEMKDIQNSGGFPVIEIKRQKTNIESYIPLIPKAQLLLSKYQFCIERTTENKALPVRSNQKINAFLKQLMELCEITKPITFHCARHTFATMMLSSAEWKVSMESVSKMLGHKNLTTTQLYGRVQKERVDSEMRKFMNGDNKENKGKGKDREDPDAGLIPA